jgi:hypothetical protein
MAQEKENFLDRWSRLKREQEAKPSVPEKPEKKESLDKPPALPPLDKLTPQSEFAGFMHPKVEDTLRRAALKKLFADPHFNIPDPFEPNSRDWNISDPISKEMLATLNQARTLLFSDEERKAADEAEQKELAGEQARNEELPEKDDEPGRQDT